jgi:hypothetical protein
MMKYSGICILLGIILSLQGFTQSTHNIVLVKEDPIEPEDYDEIRGNPYLFDDWMTGTIIAIGARRIDNVLLNFDGYQRAFALKNESVSEIEKRDYLRVEVDPAMNPEHQFPGGKKLIFQRGLHDDFENQFVQIIHVGEFLCVSYFDVNLAETVTYDVGKNVKVRKFQSEKRYFFVINQELVHFKLKEKSILKIIGQRKDLKNYIEREGLDIESEEGLIQLLNYRESLD